MIHPAIRVERLGKQYQLGLREKSYRTLRESLMDVALAPLRRLRHLSGKSRETERIWALRDVSLEAPPGEVLGVIGCNGAGKTTLLKILTMITEPTTGRAEVRGRVGSLLEVGTGFHPELTGRENVFLNGAILGMPRTTIKRKFDLIVDFSGVEKFIDTPVKRYSSGMAVRLAFAVAAHLEPEIFLIDEVLAVGDISFQQKCLNHMRALTESGMTIMLISHNMAAIQSSCTRVILLHEGRLLCDGPPGQVIARYREIMKTANRDNTAGPDPYRADGSTTGVSIVGFDLLGEDGVNRRDITYGERIRIRIDVHADRRVEHPMICFGIKRGDGVDICNFNNWYDNFSIDYIEGRCSLEGWLPPLRLVPDYYAIHVLVWPWGGGHLHGDMTRARPLAARTFGDFHVTGVGLNAHDGVFQVPAEKWRFERNGHVVEFTDVGPHSLFQAFRE